MTVYYNEFDLGAAAWLRNLIAAGLIADGVVDTRSIEDVRPDELRGFTQCHFFAGLGGWSRALRAAGWADDRPVWTGSCPCQPYSAAGKGLGFADERHLWPAFHHLIKERKPELVLGEQVASKDADPWLDLVQTDLEALGYAFGAVAFPSASLGAPHIRDRTYWVADAAQFGRGKERAHAGWRPIRNRAQGITAGLVHGSSAGWMADADGGDSGAERQQRSGEQRQQQQDGGADGMADTWPQRHDRSRATGAADGAQCGWATTAGHGDTIASGLPGPTNGFWRDADWLGCTDGKWRPVEPGTFPLANGIPARVVRLRAYGNAINVEAARAWIECVMESL